MIIYVVSTYERSIMFIMCYIHFNLLYLEKKLGPKVQGQT